MVTCDQCFGSGWSGVLGAGDKNRAPCPKCGATGRVPGGDSWGPVPLPGKGALLLLLMAGLAYLGYKFGVYTSQNIASDRPEFFAMVGGYAAVLLWSMRGTGIIGPIVVGGLVEVGGQLYWGGSIHGYILDSF